MSKPRRYIDFKLHLSKMPDGNGDGNFLVSLLPSAEVGESTLPTIIDSANKPETGLLQLLAAKQITLKDLIAIGKKLTDILLPDEGPGEGSIRDAFRRAYEKAKESEDVGVRLRLIIADHDLKEMPWEYFYLNMANGPDSLNGFLALNSYISMVRHEPLLSPHPVIAPQDATADIKALRMAIATALPKGQPKLKLGQEVQMIKKALAKFSVEGVGMTIDQEIESATPQDIKRLPKGTYIFHFGGHGVVEEKRDKAQRGGVMKKEGALLLVADKATGEEARLRASDLARDLDNAGVRLAVFAACHSAERDDRYPWDSVAGALTAAGIPAVIAMQHAIEDQAAVDFSEAFYVALAAGLSLDEAMFSGRRAMMGKLQTDSSPTMALPIEWGVPVLYTRLPNGKLFPERMEQAGIGADKIRRVFSQNVDVVTPEGKVIGVRVKNLNGAIRVEQTFGTVDGIVIAAEIDTVGSGANFEFKQTADTVSNTMIGGVIKDL